jgi:hypothetical protein
VLHERYTTERGYRGESLNTPNQGDRMNEETFNLSIRKFLKMVGVNSQREIEQAVAKGVASGDIRGNEALPARVTLDVAGLKLNVTFDGEIRLE